MRTNHALLGATATILLLIGCGNSGSSSGGSRQASTVAPSTSTSTPTTTAATTTAATTVVTSTTAGTTVPGTIGPLASASKNGPVITISSPARATYATQMALKVEGTVRDPAGVQGLTVDGTVVPFSSSGAWGTVVTLKPGLNVVVVESWNVLGRRSKQAFAVVCGQFAPDAQPIPNALAMRLNKGTFDQISTLAASKLGGPMLTQQIMAKNPLYRGSASVAGFVIASAEVNATKANFGNPSLALTPVPGALAVHVEIPNVEIEVNAKDFGGIPYSITGKVTATKAVLDASCVVTVQNGQLSTSLTNVNVDLQGFNWGINGFPSILTNLASSFVKKTIEEQVEKQVATIVPQEVNKALGGLAAPVTQTVLGSTGTFTFAPTKVDFDALGTTATADANVSFTPRPGFTPPTAPGSLVSRGGVPIHGGPKPDFAVSANEDLMNRTGHAAWKAGLMEVTFDRATATKLGLPAWVPLDAGLLTLFIPELRGKVNPTDPIAVVFTPKLPPIFAAKPKPDSIEAALGEMALQVWTEPVGRPRELVLEITLHARVQAGVALNAQNAVKVAVTQRPFIDASLSASPLAPDLDLMGVTNLVQFAVPPMIQIVASQWSGFPLPLYPGLSPKNVDIDADGAQKTFVTVKGDF